MKINIAFIDNYNNLGIGGTERCFSIYFRKLHEEQFSKYFLHVVDGATLKEVGPGEFEIGEHEVMQFLADHDIKFVYLAGDKLDSQLSNTILDKYIGLTNVNFTQRYTKDPRILNMIISKTDYWKLRFIHGDLQNAYVSYNPMDVDARDEVAKNNVNYRSHFGDKKLILGRIGRSEPSKWSFLIIASMLRLQRLHNYNYGFIFAGMPYLYRLTLKMFLNKKMYKSIVFIPEMREYKDIATFYSTIDVFRQTARIGESFGNVIAEAFSFKVPAITDHKAFYRNGKVIKRLYDAQIELVEHGVNGYYASTPKAFVDTIEGLTKENIKPLGEAAYNKSKTVYNIHTASDTIAKILYNVGKEKGIYTHDEAFEKLVQNPSDTELAAYKDEYLAKLELCKKIHNHGALYSGRYSFVSWSFRQVEYAYLILRKILKKYGCNIEKFGY